MKKFLLLLMVGIFVVGCVGCGCSQNSSSGSNSSEKFVYEVGDVIAYGDETVIVTNFEQNYDSGDPSIVPSKGKQFVKVDLTLENKSEDDIVIDAYEFKLEDSNGNLESIAIPTYSLENQFLSVELVQDGKTSGSLVFEAPINDKNLKLVYDPGFYDGDRLEINLQ